MNSILIFTLNIFKLFFGVIREDLTRIKQNMRHRNVIY